MEIRHTTKTTLCILMIVIVHMHAYIQKRFSLVKIVLRNASSSNHLCWSRRWKLFTRKLALCIPHQRRVPACVGSFIGCQRCLAHGGSWPPWSAQRIIPMVPSAETSAHLRGARYSLTWKWRAFIIIGFLAVGFSFLFGFQASCFQNATDSIIPYYKTTFRVSGRSLSHIQHSQIWL